MDSTAPADEHGGRSSARGALSRSEERFRRALEIETVGVIFFRTDGAITFSNAAFLAMSGYDRDDLEQGLVRWDTMTPPEHMEISRRAVSEFLAYGRTTPYEKEYIRKDGSRWWGLFSATRVSDDEGAEFIIDISARRQSEQALRQARAELEDRVRERTRELAEINDALRAEIAERRRAELTARELALRLTLAEQEVRRRISRVLHDDLQQILYGIRMKLGLLDSAITQESLTQSRATIAQLGDWLSTAIDMTRQLTVELSPPLVEGEGLAEALGWLATQMRETHGLETTLNASPVDVGADMRVLLFRVARELLFNVVKHSGTNRAEIKLHELDDDVVLRVSDHGYGIDPEAARPRGLGLASARERLELLGGSIATVSAPQGGTEVIVTVPRGEFDGRTGRGRYDGTSHWREQA
jgi:PAS domain S-box-containing protein